MIYTVSIGYNWGMNLITKPYSFTSLAAAQKAVNDLLPGVVWEDQKTYLIVDLHQFDAPVVFHDEHGEPVEIFLITIDWDGVDKALPYAGALTGENAWQEVRGEQ